MFLPWLISIFQVLRTWSRSRAPGKNHFNNLNKFTCKNKSSWEGLGSLEQWFLRSVCQVGGVLQQKQMAISKKLHRHLFLPFESNRKVEHYFPRQPALTLQTRLFFPLPSQLPVCHFSMMPTLQISSILLYQWGKDSTA